MTSIPPATRPHMPGYGIQPADKGIGLLPWNFVEERMAKSRNYWIASTHPDGRPHAVPVWGFWHKGVFYFGTGTRSQKARNFAANPAVSVHLESGDEAVILEGRVERVNDAELERGLDQEAQTKYGMDITNFTPLYKLRVQRAFAWREQDFPSSATRWEFGDHNPVIANE